MNFFNFLEKYRKELLVFIPMVLLYMFSYFQRTAVPGTIFNALQSDMNLSAMQITGVGVSFVWVYSLSQLVVGMLADKYCGVRVITVGVLLLLIGAVLFPVLGILDLPLVISLGGIYFARVITGLGASSLYLSLVKETRRFFGRENYSMMFGVVYFVGYSGGMCGTLPFGRLCAVFRWQYVMLAISAIGIILYIIFLFAKRSISLPPVTSAKITLKPLLNAFINPYLWMIFFCSSMIFSIYFVIQTIFGKKFLIDSGMGETAAEAAIFMLTIVSMFTLLGVGTLIKKFGEKRRPFMLTASCVNLLNTAMMFCALAFEWPVWCFAIGYQFYAFASGFAIAFALEAQEVTCRDAIAQTTGFNNMGNYMCVAIFSLFVGQLLDVFAPEGATGVIKYPKEAYMVLFAVFLGISLISCVVTFFIPETKGHFFSLKLETWNPQLYPRVNKFLQSVKGYYNFITTGGKK